MAGDSQFIQLNTMAGGENVAVDSIGAVNYQAMKVMLGSDGVADLYLDSGQQTMANSVPVVLASNHGDVPVILSLGTASIGTMSVANSVNIANTGGNVNITNSAGWIVAQSNTSDLVRVVNSAGWIVSVANTLGLFRNVSSTIINSAGWIVAVSNTGSPIALTGTSDVAIVGSVVVSNTNPTVSVINSAGWIVAVSNTGSPVALTGTSDVAVVGVVSIANTGGDVSVISFTDGKTYKYGSINATATDNLIVSAVAGSSIFVTSVLLSSVGPNVAKFQNDTLGASVTGPVYLAASGGFVLNAPTEPGAAWFRTASGKPLGLNLVSATSVGGAITYYEG